MRTTRRCPTLVGPLDIELRVATIPSSGGVEDVVMRILAAGETIPIEKLGLTPHTRERIEQPVSKPHGLFYVCGPTGSGKTTTLHSILKFLKPRSGRPRIRWKSRRRVCAMSRSIARRASISPW
jgi:type II secretory ATPase GspE/PulE/Tfp pilus assembly ATPase PilB-like protein